MIRKSDRKELGAKIKRQRILKLITPLGAQQTSRLWDAANRYVSWSPHCGNERVRRHLVFQQQSEVTLKGKEKLQVLRTQLHQKAREGGFQTQTNDGCVDPSIQQRKRWPVAVNLRLTSHPLGLVKINERIDRYGKRGTKTNITRLVHYSDDPSGYSNWGLH